MSTASLSNVAAGTAEAKREEDSPFTQLKAALNSERAAVIGSDDQDFPLTSGALRRLLDSPDSLERFIRASFKLQGDRDLTQQLAIGLAAHARDKLLPRAVRAGAVRAGVGAGGGHADRLGVVADRVAEMASDLRSHFAEHQNGDAFGDGAELLPVHSRHGFNVIDETKARRKEPLYVRKAHFALWKHVEAAYDAFIGGVKSASRRVAMVGNPGIGKSWSLIYMLGRLLAKGVPIVVFYTMAQERVHVFRQTSGTITVKRLHRHLDDDFWPLLDEQTTVLLIDPSQGAKLGTPHSPLTSTCLSVIATSPHPGNLGDVKANVTDFIYVPMLSKQEATEFLERQYPGSPDIVQDRMAVFEICGGAPRDLMGKARPADIRSALAIAVMGYDVDKLLAWAHCEGNRIGPDQASHKFVQIKPTHNYTKFVVWPLSAVALDVMLARLVKVRSDRWLAAMNPTANVGVFDRILAGWLFEAYAHARASDASLDAKFRTYRIKALFGEQTEGYLHPSLTNIIKAPEVLSKKVDDNTVLLAPIAGDNATHKYHGTVSGFPGLDAVIQRSGSKRGSLLLQITVQLQHVIKVFGLAIALRLLQVLPQDEFIKFSTSAKVEEYAKRLKRKRGEHNQGGAGKRGEGHTSGKHEEEPAFASTDVDAEMVSTVEWPSKYITPSDRFTHLVTVVPDAECYRRGVNKAQSFVATSTAALTDDLWPAWLHDVRQWVLFLPIDDEKSADYRKSSAVLDYIHATAQAWHGDGPPVAGARRVRVTARAGAGAGAGAGADAGAAAYHDGRDRDSTQFGDEGSQYSWQAGQAAKKKAAKKATKKKAKKKKK